MELNFLESYSDLVNYFGVIILLGFLFKNIFFAKCMQPEDVAWRGYENAGNSNLKHISKVEIEEIIKDSRSYKGVYPYFPTYPNGWLCALPAEDVRSGQMKRVKFCGEDILIWRDEEGVISVFRANADNEGGLGMLTSKEIYGFIFVWHHSQGKDAEWELEEVFEISNGYPLQAFHMDFSAHIQDIAENSADLQHFGPIHGNSLKKPGKSLLSRIRSLKVAELDDFTLEIVPVERNHEVIIKMSSRIYLFGLFPISQNVTKVKQIGPGLAISTVDTIFGSMTLVEAYKPIEPLNTRLSVKIFCDRKINVTLFGNAYRSSTVDQIWRDANIFNRKVQKINPCWSKEDKPLKIFRRWYSQFYTEAGKT